jgi:hypothetical protein
MKARLLILVSLFSLLLASGCYPLQGRVPAAQAPPQPPPPQQAKAGDEPDGWFVRRFEDLPQFPAGLTWEQLTEEQLTRLLPGNYQPWKPSRCDLAVSGTTIDHLMRAGKVRGLSRCGSLARLYINTDGLLKGGRPNFVGLHRYFADPGFHRVRVAAYIAAFGEDAGCGGTEIRVYDRGGRLCFRDEGVGLR